MYLFYFSIIFGDIILLVIFNVFLYNFSLDFPPAYSHELLHEMFKWFIFRLSKELCTLIVRPLYNLYVHVARDLSLRRNPVLPGIEESG